MKVVNRDASKSLVGVMKVVGTLLTVKLLF